MIRTCTLLSTMTLMMMHGAPLREVAYDAVILPAKMSPIGQRVPDLPGNEQAGLRYFVPTAPGRSICNCSARLPLFSSELQRSTRAAISLSSSDTRAQDRVNGIRILDPRGREVRFLDTSPYVPMMLAFDANDELWSHWMGAGQCEQRARTETGLFPGS